MAGIVDSEALKECINAGIGKNVQLNLGGKVDHVFGKPLKINARVLFLSSDSVMSTNRGAAVVEEDGMKNSYFKNPTFICGS